MVQANQVLNQMQEAAKTGGAVNVPYPVEKEPLFVSFFDASLGKSEMMSAQQAEVHLLAGIEVGRKPCQASFVEFHSSKVHRVVCSSLAAESCTMTPVADKILYNMALFDVMFHGRTEIQPQWRKQLHTGGAIITDAKGLHNHVNKTGSMAAEKRTVLDRLMAKKGGGGLSVLKLRWTPTWKQLADPLMATDLLRELRWKGYLCLVQASRDHREKARRSGQRKAQTERRKLQMQVTRKHLLSPM